MNLKKRIFNILVIIFITSIVLGCGSSNKNETKQDNKPPVITLKGDKSITILKDTVYVEAGAIAIDEEDGDISSKIVIINPLDTSTIGKYLITYDVNDSNNNKAVQVTRTITVQDKNTTIISIEELESMLEDDSIPYTTEADFNQSEYAKHHLPDDEARRLERMHSLVAIATDPDPEWFSTHVDKDLIIAKTGESYTVQLNKERVDGTTIGPVDNDKLRLVVRIQRAKNDFEYVTNNDIDKYAKWNGQGVLEVHVPEDLNKGRLLIGVRPNFDDVAMSAIAERWSTVILAEVWQTQSGVQTVDTNSVIFPIDNEATDGFASGSEFTKEEIALKVQKQLTEQSNLMLPLVVKDMDLQVGDLLSYMFKGKPYSGKVFSLKTQGKQQFALMTPEFFEVYDITDADDGFMVTEGLYPENVVYREGGAVPTDINESDSTSFSKVQKSEKLSDIVKFFQEKCSFGKSNLTFNVNFSLNPLDAAVDTSINAMSSGKTECKWEATTKGIKLNNLFIAGGPLVIITKLLGTGGEIKPLGEVIISVNQAPGFGLNMGYSLVNGGHFKVSTIVQSIGGLGSRNLFGIHHSSVEAKIGANLGINFKLKGISEDGYLGIALNWLNITLDDIGIESETKITESLIGKMNNAIEVYDSGKPSQLALSIGAEVTIIPTTGIENLLKYFDHNESLKASVAITLLEIKSIADYTYHTLEDSGQGTATLSGLRIKSSYLNDLLPSSKGVLSPIDKTSSVFNDYTEKITYDINECEKNDEYKIETPAIACAGWLCGEVDKKVELCQGKLTVSPVVADARINEVATGTAEIINNTANTNVKVVGKPLEPIESSLVIEKDKTKFLDFSKECPSKAGVYRGEVNVSIDGTPFKANNENIMVCHDDDTRGDPHIVTADGLGYDYYASGDYILSRINDVDGYEVQARFLPGYETSWPQAISLRVGNDIVEIQGKKEKVTGINLNTLSVWVNGEKNNLAENKFLRLASGGILAITNTVSRASKIFPTSITIIWPKGTQTESYGVILNVASIGDPFVAIQIARPNTFAGKERGLMGNNNKNPQDDFIRRNGQILGGEQNLSFTELYGLFGTDWLVRPYESLFRNPEAIKPKFPTGVVTLTPAQRALGEQACMALTGFYREACIIDVGLTGSVELVQEYYADTDDLNNLSEQIVTPNVNKAIYSLKADEKVEFTDSNKTNLYYTQSLQVKHESGEGNFMLLVRPPRGAKVILGTGEQSYTGEGNFDTDITVDCRELNMETNSTLFKKTGAVQLWIQDPLSGTASQMLSEVNLYCVEPEPFITTWEVSEFFNTLKIPVNGEGYNYSIDWGDGTINKAIDTNTSHTYDESGTYTIKILGEFPHLSFSNRWDLLSVEQWGSIKWKSMSNAFANCRQVVINATDSPDLSNVRDMSLMFSNTLKFNQDISEWDTSNITDMNHTFANAQSFNQDISSWDTSKVTNMSHMFAGTPFNQNIESWDTTSVTNMSGMFLATPFDQDIGSWDTSNVKSMDMMFAAATSFNQNISSWNTSKVTDMSRLFWGAESFNHDINAWNTSNVKNMNFMFSVAKSFNHDIGAWNTSKVTDMSGMFFGAESFNHDINAWNTASVTNMSYMFRDATAFNGDIGSWNTANVTDMNSMFWGAKAFNQDIGSWNTANVTDMNSMFGWGAIDFNQNINSWNTANVTDMNWMFFGAKSFNQNIGLWNTSSVRSMYNMFYGATSFNQNIGTWDTSNVINMQQMFTEAEAFNQNISSWDTSNVNNMGYMFFKATSFSNQDLSTWDVSKVTYRTGFSTDWGAGNKEPNW